MRRAARAPNEWSRRTRSAAARRTTSSPKTASGSGSVASGARVITDPILDAPSLVELFGPAVQVYETPDDLARLATLADPDAVSYTHLTLPTNREV